MAAVNAIYALTLIITVASGQSIPVTSGHQFSVSKCNEVGFEMTWQIMRAAHQQGFDIEVTHRCTRIE